MMTRSFIIILALYSLLMYACGMAFEGFRSPMDYMEGHIFMRGTQLDTISQEKHEGFEIKKIIDPPDWCAYGVYNFSNDYPIFFLGTQNQGEKLIEGEIFLPPSSIKKGVGYYRFPGQVNPDIVKPRWTYAKHQRIRLALTTIYIFIFGIFALLLQYIKTKEPGVFYKKTLAYIAMLMLVITMVWKMLSAVS